MAEKIRPELLGFLTPSELPLNILVVESGVYLAKLREMFPRATLYFVAAEIDAEAQARLRALSVQGIVCDYLAEPLPFGPETVDYILSDLALELSGNPQDIAAGFAHFLRQTGAFLTSFRNIRHYSVLEELWAGHYYHVAARLFARPEFLKLLYASYYKDVRVRPQRRAAPPEVLKKFLAAGVENLHDDLETEYWLVYAARSMPELALLKSLFTASQRAELSRLLHRIEYGVETEQQVAAFWAFYDAIGLFPDYTASFVKEAVFHHERFYRRLLAFSAARRGELKKILAAAQTAATSEEEAGRLKRLQEEVRAD